MNSISSAVGGASSSSSPSIPIRTAGRRPTEAGGRRARLHQFETHARVICAGVRRAPTGPFVSAASRSKMIVGIGRRLPLAQADSSFPFSYLEHLEHLVQRPFKAYFFLSSFSLDLEHLVQQPILRGSTWYTS